MIIMISLEKSIIIPIFTQKRLLWALQSTHDAMFNSSWKLDGALAQKLHRCITDLLEPMMLHEIPDMDKGFQLSLNKTHNRDREILTDETWRQETNDSTKYMVYLCSSSNFGYFLYFIMQC